MRLRDYGSSLLIKGHSVLEEPKPTYSDITKPGAWINMRFCCITRCVCMNALIMGNLI